MFDPLDRRREVVRVHLAHPTQTLLRHRVRLNLRRDAHVLVDELRQIVAANHRRGGATAGYVLHRNLPALLLGHEFRHHLGKFGIVRVEVVEVERHRRGIRGGQRKRTLPDVIRLDHDDPLAPAAVVRLEPLAQGVRAVRDGEFAPLIARGVQGVDADGGHLGHKLVVRAAVEQAGEVKHVAPGLHLLERAVHDARLPVEVRATVGRAQHVDPAGLRERRPGGGGGGGCRGDIRGFETRRGGWRGGRVIEPESEVVGVVAVVVVEETFHLSLVVVPRRRRRLGVLSDVVHARRVVHRRAPIDEIGRRCHADRSRARHLGTGGGTRYRVGSMVTEVSGDEKDRAGRNQPRGAALAAASGASRCRAERVSPRPAFRDEQIANSPVVDSSKVTVWPPFSLRSARRGRSVRARAGRRETHDAHATPRPSHKNLRASSAARARRVGLVRRLPPRARVASCNSRDGHQPVPPRSAWRSSARRHPSDPTSALDAAMSDPARIPDPQRSSGTGSRPDGDAAGASASTPPRADDRPKLELTGSMKKRRRKAEAKQTMKGMKNLIGEVRSNARGEATRAGGDFPGAPVATSGPASAPPPSRVLLPPPLELSGPRLTGNPPPPPRHLPAVPRGDASASLSPYSTATQDEAASALSWPRVRGWSRRRRRAVLRGRGGGERLGWAPLMALRARGQPRARDELRAAAAAAGDPAASPVRAMAGALGKLVRSAAAAGRMFSRGAREDDFRARHPSLPGPPPPPRVFRFPPVGWWEGTPSPVGASAARVWYRPRALRRVWRIARRATRRRRGALARRRRTRTGGASPRVWRRRRRARRNTPRRGVRGCSPSRVRFSSRASRALDPRGGGGVRVGDARDRLDRRGGCAPVISAAADAVAERSSPPSPRSPPASAREESGRPWRSRRRRGLVAAARRPGRRARTPRGRRIPRGGRGVGVALSRRTRDARRRAAPPRPTREARRRRPRPPSRWRPRRRRRAPSGGAPRKRPRALSRELRRHRVALEELVDAMAALFPWPARRSRSRDSPINSKASSDGTMPLAPSATLAATAAARASFVASTLDATRAVAVGGSRAAARRRRRARRKSSRTRCRLRGRRRDALDVRRETPRTARSTRGGSEITRSARWIRSIPTRDVGSRRTRD